MLHFDRIQYLIGQAPKIFYIIFLASPSYEGVNRGHIRNLHEKSCGLGH